MLKLFSISCLFVFIATNSYAAAGAVDSGDTAFILIATALVMLMTPGLAFFYSGMVRKKNAVSTIMHSYMKLCVVTIVWVILGYSIAFGHSIGGVFGGFDFLGFSGVGQEPLEGMTIPHILFAMFQGMFAVITAAITSGLSCSTLGCTRMAACCIIVRFDFNIPKGKLVEIRIASNAYSPLCIG